MPKTKLIGILKPGDTIFYYNRWSGLDMPKIRDCFEFIEDEADIKVLKPGSVIWKDEEPYSSHGKVYGFTCQIVTGIKKVNYPGEGRGYEISFEEGMTTWPYLHRLAKIIDEEKLISLLAKYPKALEPPLF